MAICYKRGLARVAGVENYFIQSAIILLQSDYFLLLFES